MAIVAGIDVGSLSAKSVILKDKKVISSDVILTKPDGKSAQNVLSNSLAKAGLKFNDINYIVATGYGRLNIPFANFQVTEISCHARGLWWSKPEVRMILDIGGQDCKVIRLNERGEVEKFKMNDKCAAGTGRYLERVARVLSIPLDQIGPMSLTTVEGPVKVSSFCTVFAEREVSQLSVQGKHKSDILAGAFRALATRIRGLISSVGIAEPFYISGGVAKNVGVLHYLEEELSVKVNTVEEPQIIGALGAALFADEKYSNNLN